MTTSLYIWIANLRHFLICRFASNVATDDTDETDQVPYL
jgi:hypothetical protein